jgi:hypothetical protein
MRGVGGHYARRPLRKLPVRVLHTHERPLPQNMNTSIIITCISCLHLDKVRVHLSRYSVNVHLRVSISGEYIGTANSHS